MSIALTVIAAIVAQHVPQARSVNPRAMLAVRASAQQERETRCPVEPYGMSPRGGGMCCDGWDGPDLGPATVFWHVEGSSPDLGSAQRQALITAMQAWADVVQITFFELPVANAPAAVDWNFLSGDHCSAESAHCGDPDCVFDSGLIGHAGFPLGGHGTCGGAVEESWAGNVHFNEGFVWEQDSEGPPEAFSLTLVACHELGHALGLLHSVGPSDIMFPSGTNTSSFAGLSANDIANIQTGYAAGTGEVVTLEQSGVWVNGGWTGLELGVQPLPFDTLAEGVAGVPRFSEGVVVHLQAGLYPETATITQRMLLQAEGGIVVIGQ